MGYQEWTIKNGQSRIDNQEWTIKNEQSRMDNQEWTIKNGQSRMDIQEWTIKNGQSIETGNTGHTRHRTKTKKTQDRKDEPHQNPGMNSGCSRRVSSSCLLSDTPCFLYNQYVWDTTMCKQTQIMN